MIASRTALTPLLLALCVIGCATRPVSDVDEFAARSASNSFEVVDRGVNRSGLVLPIAHDRQTSAASCGAHALASVIRYWRGSSGAVDGDSLFETSPPADAVNGYSLAELLTIARGAGLLANAARISQADLIAELESGRPVLIPIQAPAVYIEPRTLPGENVPFIGFVRNAAINQVARISEWTGIGMVGHYMVVAGYEHDRFVVVEPVQGFRTISFERLARYRRAFTDAAIVFSANAPPAAPAN